MTVLSLVGLGYSVPEEAALANGPLREEYALLVVVWLALAIVSLDACGRVLSAWRKSGAVLMIAVLAVVMTGVRVALTPVATSLGMAAVWNGMWLWMPASIVTFAAGAALMVDRRQFIAERTARLRAIALTESTAAAYRAAYAEIAEAARSTSQAAAAAVRSAMLIARESSRTDILRTALELEVRAPVRDTSRRVHDLQPEVPASRARFGWSLGAWLDELNQMPVRFLAAGFVIIAVLNLPAVLAQGIGAAGVAARALMLAGVVAVTLQALGRRALRWAPRLLRRAVLPVVVVICVRMATWGLAEATHPGATGSEIWRAGVAAVPAGVLIVLLPGLLAAGLRQRRIELADLDSRAGLAQAGLTQAMSDVDRIRGEVIAHLHSYVQGKAAAAIVVMDMQERNGSDMSDVLAAILTELGEAGFDANVGSRAVPMPGEPLAHVIDCWAHVFELESHIDDVPGQLQFLIAQGVQDALINAAVHGRARRVWVRVEVRGDAVRWSVDDDGMGPPVQPREGLGMARLTDVGASWQLERSQRGGAQLIAHLPIGEGVSA